MENDFLTLVDREIINNNDEEHYPSYNMDMLYAYLMYNLNDLNNIIKNL